MKPSCALCIKSEKQDRSAPADRQAIGKDLFQIFEHLPAFKENQAVDSRLSKSEKSLEPSTYSKRRAATGARHYNEFESILQSKQKLNNMLSDVPPSKQKEETLSQSSLGSLIQQGFLKLKPSRVSNSKDGSLIDRFILGEQVFDFSGESEKIIAKKILELTLDNLQKVDYGKHQLSKLGVGLSISGSIRGYDEYFDHFDWIDLQESLLNTAKRDPFDMRVEPEDLKTRIPLHSTRSVNVLLIDVSYSMLGSKFKGALMATLALQQLFEDEFNDDKIHVIGFNEVSKVIKSGDTVRLFPQGNTDIGRAIRMGMSLLERESGNKNIFLITDGEPTVSEDSNLTPEDSAYYAAYDSGLRNIRLNIIMLDQSERLASICRRMAALNASSSIITIENPLNLKEFMIQYFRYLHK